MTNIIISQKYSILIKILNLKFSSSISYKIFSFFKKCDYFFQEFLKKETILIEKYNLQTDEKGFVIIPSDFEDKENFTREYNELAQEQVNLSPLVLKIKDIENVNLSAADMLVLEGLINFEE